MFGNILNEIDYFSDYLRAHAGAGGNDIVALNRSPSPASPHTFPPSLNRAPNDIGRDTITNAPCRGADPCNTNASCRCSESCGYGRETGRLTFAESFMLTDDLLVPRAKNPRRDEVGAALPTAIIRQIFTPEAMAALAAVNEHMPPLVRLAAETGRRPGELVSLKYDCVTPSPTVDRS